MPSTEAAAPLFVGRDAGFDPLDYSAWDNNNPAYIAAIHAGLACDYKPMMQWVA